MPPQSRVGPVPARGGIAFLPPDDGEARRRSLPHAARDAAHHRASVSCRRGRGMDEKGMSIPAKFAEMLVFLCRFAPARGESGKAFFSKRGSEELTRGRLFGEGKRTTYARTYFSGVGSVKSSLRSRSLTMKSTSRTCPCRKVEVRFHLLLSQSRTRRSALWISTLRTATSSE